MADWRIDRSKILDYLLNEASPAGAAKAQFFLGRGFGRNAWQEFHHALVAHTQTARLYQVDSTSPYGVKRVFLCEIATPDRTSPCIHTVWRTVWQQRNGDHWLITAYPFRRQ
jgi:hypothetical protein